MKNKVLWVIIIPIIISVIGAAMYDWIKDFPFLHTISNAAVWLYGSLVSFLNFELKIWWILLGIIILIGVFLIIVYSQPEEKKAPAFLDYIEDKFGEFVWKWEWGLNHKKQWTIQHLKPHCPICKTPIIEGGLYGGYTYKCPRCSYKTDKYEDINDIGTLISDNANRGIWNKNKKLSDKNDVASLF